MNKKIPQWVKDKAEANKPKEEVVFIGEMGVAGVIDGKLPNGNLYTWKRLPRRNRK
jgi:hypothetical protein